ncbi:tyrosylprotein sulfotransferase 1, like [Takifugu rubripes]|uniref:Protein-tyrosine sulfotransferase n=1 Tax=Takifugu rubripes TaxID=31033 RepID=H2U9A8_TAKRU|nr:protein-tyrosine sulfotransferase 1 [Takifugu rubripes]XP_011609686.1 protein-tyrosine sulfotransferase 1 [Takifugu rubripes]XP_011609687.1 protein-tyrosine sulfotransferase 1 [Takifugu rubripes]|eukprot:XP_011609685.1 PREDICTED: protein-tyrosine sulfotransferase 1 [Takifugu rubripes]
MRNNRLSLLLGCVLLCSASLLYLGMSGIECPPKSHRHRWMELNLGLANQNLSLNEHFPEDTPLIFIGGFPRSGTTLMRVMLDAHRHVRCGEETRVIPRLLTMRATWSRSVKERMRLDEAGVTDQVLDSAVRAFLLEVIVGHGEPAPRLCNKDPFALKSLSYLSHIFPKAKFVLMLRDGRATVHSMISRKVTISGFDLTSYRDCLTKWSSAVETMFSQCQAAGEDRCLPIRYEHLVLHTEEEMRKLLRFLELQWDPAVLHHEELIGKVGGVSLSKVERSTDQVMKPVNTEALSKWVGQIPADVISEMDEIAPMLSRLGYDPQANPPDYTKPEPMLSPFNSSQILKPTEVQHHT